jgi:hypothetical protein
MRIDGKFVVETSEGVMVCDNGYLAIDSRGFPYPITEDEFENIYELVREDVDGSETEEKVDG